MAEKERKKISKTTDGENGRTVEFGTGNGISVSSEAFIEGPTVESTLEADAELAGDVEAATDKAEEYSPEFLKLAVPELPQLQRGNRAQLLMQSPNRLFFYWSVGKDPYHTLSRVFGEPGNYSLVIRLMDLNDDSVKVIPARSEGSTWFNVESASEYKVELGFYAADRPFIRIMFSNTVATPRKSPSPRSAATANWNVTATKFAEVLDVAGFSQDAFDVAVAGDDWDAAETATMSAFSQFVGKPHSDLEGVRAEEIRFALFALASGAMIDTLRGRIGERLYSILERMKTLDGEKALAALRTEFEFDAEDVEIEDTAEQAIFGASLVNFPRRRRRPGKFPDLNPLSSHGLTAKA